MERSELLDSLFFKSEAVTRSQARRFLVIFLPAVFILLLISGYLIFTDLRAFNEGVLKDEELVVSRGAAVVRDSVRSAVTDTLFLARLSESRLGIDRGDAAFENDLTQRFRLFAEAKRIYRQIRLLNIDGAERIRVNYENGDARSVLASELQSKADRYYVVEGLKLKPGQIYISRFDLNIEHGVIETPPKPMVRLVAPVVGPDGAVQGIVVTNVDGKEILDAFSLSILPADKRVMMVDQHGYILRGGNEGEAWAFMFDRLDLSLESRYPDSWDRMNKLGVGQFEDAAGLWTFQTIYPVGKTLTTGGAPGEWSYVPTDYNWKIVAFVPEGIIGQSRWQRISASLFVSILLLLALGLGSWILARTQSELVNQGAMLEQTVEERTAELISMNDVLSRARVEAEAASDAKSRFLANMSHELRTPLNAISGFAEIMNGEFLGPLGNDTYKTYAADIGASAKHLTSLIQDLIDISQIEADAMNLREEAVDVATVTKDCMLIVSGNASLKGVKLQHEVPHDVPRLFADPTRVRQILINLLSNAVKFTPKGGTVFCSSYVDRNGAYNIVVRDTGNGIPKSVKSQIFKPFARADDPSLQSEEGVGLGLAITHSLVDMHGGTIHVESMEGKGTTFVITFPASRTIK